MSEDLAPTAPPAVPSLEAPPAPVDPLDPGAIGAPTSVPAAEPELTPEQQRDQMKDSLLDQLKKKYPDVITDVWLDEQKRHFGRVYVFPMFDDIFLIRPLRRGEWKKLNEGGADGKPLDQDAMEEAIAMKATLFPPIKQEDVGMGGLAGLPTSITNFVELISGFRPEIGPILI